MHFVRLSAGEVLFEQDDTADAMYVVVKGALQAIITQGNGKRIVSEEIHPGILVGEIALLSGGKRNATIKAKKESDLIIFTREDFDEIVVKYPEIRKQLLDMVVYRLRKAQWMKILTGYFGDIDE